MAFSVDEYYQSIPPPVPPHKDKRVKIKLHSGAIDFECEGDIDLIEKAIEKSLFVFVSSHIEENEELMDKIRKKYM